MREPFGYEPARHETLRWTSSLLQVGGFHVGPDAPDFASAGQIGRHPVLVFPRTPVRIRIAPRVAFTTDVLTAVLYNVDTPFRRESIAGQPDCCDWFHFAPSLIEELLGEVATAGSFCAGSPFPVHSVSVRPRLYALQRLVVRHVEEAESPDILFVEESMIHIARGVLESAFRAFGARPTLAPAGREIARKAGEIVGCRFAERSSIAEIASTLGCSPSYLCRTVKQHYGTTLHGHRLHVRLAASLDRVAERGSDLAAIALDLGFDSHSHFTATFRRHLGVTPSDFRSTASSSAVRSLRSTLLGRCLG